MLPEAMTCDRGGSLVVLGRAGTGANTFPCALLLREHSQAQNPAHMAGSLLAPTLVSFPNKSIFLPLS